MRASASVVIAIATSIFTFTLVGCGSGVGNNSANTSNPSVRDLSSVGLTATGASLVCPSSGHNAYTTYSSAFPAVTKAIIANVVAELGANGTTNLGTSFAGAGTGSLPSNQDNLTTFEGSLDAFLVFLYGGPKYVNYQVGTSNATGNPPILVTFVGPQGMQEAHTGFNITSAQYTYFVTNMVVPALTGLSVPSGDVSACFAPPLLDSTFIASIVGQ